ncbi:AMP-binding protein [Sulfitobacter sp. SK012]|uniref:AMP-binding protein n=1 Tax=Sulfitobacter sp. SK012 TaxID=1389005 RepID=UPI0020C7668D|nr:AMP-binding protein [Sulfitobacter sp. SK012]
MVVDGVAFSYGQFDKRVKKLSRVLFETCDPDRGMGIITRSATEMACLFVAALRVGVPVININPELTPSERAHALRASNVAHVFIDRDIDDDHPLPENVTRIVVDAAKPDKTSFVGKLLGSGRKSAPKSDYEAHIDAAEPLEMAIPVDPDRTAMMLMTSGTTSNPKVVELSHKNIKAQLDAFREVYQFTAETRLLNPLPLHFTDGILHGPLHVLFVGATLYRPSVLEFDKLESMLLSVYRDRITHFFVVPTLLNLILSLPESFDDAFDTPDFRMLRSSGDRLGLPVWKNFEDRFSVRVCNAYGLSETVCEASYCGPQDGTYRLGTAGKPVGCEIRVMTSQGEEVALGDEGELWIRGDIVAKGYRNNPDATSNAFSDGWFRTGDLARLDQDGFVSITGRESGIIISGGININPADVSDVIMKLPWVTDAAVFGIDDPTFGEKVVAAVALDTEHDDKARAREEIVGFCRDNLARHKVPRTVLLLNEIPRTLSGKAIVRKLRDIARAPEMTGEGRSNEVAKDVIRIASKVFNCEPKDLTLNSTAKSAVGWDSFAHVQLILEAERAYGVTIPPRAFLNIRSLKELAQILEEQNGTS